ncbi:MAG TPA: TetR family transcriptional regulator [Micromonosporaceae bacterium]|nr:TetR family transcriptional regulator [Micromonosporaceae bacterium]
MSDPGQSPSRRRSDATRAAILRAARERFASDGYERATIRAIAADAKIDPSMVMRYYGSKDRLFAAAAKFDLRLPDLNEIPPDQVGAVLVAHFLDRWDGDETMMALLRAGVTNPTAAQRMREIFAGQLVPVARALPEAKPDGGGGLSPEGRAGLVASQILGLALTRYVLHFPPVTALGRDDLIAWVGPTVQRYLVGQP